MNVIHRPPHIRETSSELRAAGDQFAAHVDVLADRLGHAASRLEQRLHIVEDAAFDARDGMHRPAQRLARAMTDFVGEARRSVERIAQGRRRNRWMFWR